MQTTLLNSKAARSGTAQSSRESGELEGTDPRVDTLAIAKLLMLVQTRGARPLQAKLRTNRVCSVPAARGSFLEDWESVQSSDDSYVIPSSFPMGGHTVDTSFSKLSGTEKQQTGVNQRVSVSLQLFS